LSTGPRATSQYYRWTVCRTRRAGNSSPRGAGARCCTPFTRGRGAGAVPWHRAPRCLYGREPSSCNRIAPRGFAAAGRLHHVAANGAGVHPRRGPRPVGGGPACSVATWCTGCGSAPPSLSRCGPTGARAARGSRGTPQQAKTSAAGTPAPGRGIAGLTGTADRRQPWDCPAGHGCFRPRRGNGLPGVPGRSWRRGGEFLRGVDCGRRRRGSRGRPRLPRPGK